MRHIVFRIRRRAEAQVPDAPDYADDLAPDWFILTRRDSGLDVFTNWVLARKELLNKSVVDDNHLRRVLIIPLIEIAPRQLWNSHRTKVVDSDRSIIAGRKFSLWQRPAFGFKGDSNLVPTQRQRQDCACRPDSGKQVDLGYQLLIEIDLPLLGIFHLRQANGKTQDVMRIKTGIDLLQPTEALNQQTGANQQHHSYRHFGDNERRTKPISPSAVG